MELLITAITPLLVNFVAAQAKSIGAKQWIKAHKGYFRIALLVLSFVLIVGKSALLGEELDIVSLNTLIETGFAFFSSQGVYLIAKK